MEINIKFTSNNWRHLATYTGSVQTSTTNKPTDKQENSTFLATLAAGEI